MLLQFSELIGTALLGEQWNGVGLVIGLMGLTHGLAWVVGVNGEIYRAMNKPSYETIMSGSTMIIYIIGYIYSIQYGLEIFLWTRFALCLLSVIIHLFFLKKLLQLQIIPILSFIILVACISSICVTIINNMLVVNMSNVWIKILVGGMFSSVLIAMILFYIERNGIVKDLVMLIEKRNY